MKNVLTDALSGVKSVAVGGHIRPDGDCVGSCMGLLNYLSDNYKNISVDLYLEPIPNAYKYVGHTEQIISDSSKDKVYDLFIALDCGDRERLGQFAKYFDMAVKTLCIDHHISNQAFADINEIRPAASSTAEILFDLMEPEKINIDTAKCLYMGIICDTGCFKHSNTSEHTMAAAGKLLSKGVNQAEMMDKVFYEKTFMQNQLLGRCLLNSYLTLDHKCIVCVASAQLLNEFGAVSSDLEGVIDQLRITKGVEVAVLITENNEGGCKISMRSCAYADVAAVAQHFGGGGHVRAAGASCSQCAADILDELLAKIKEQLTSDD